MYPKSKFKSPRSKIRLARKLSNFHTVSSLLSIFSLFLETFVTLVISDFLIIEAISAFTLIIFTLSGSDQRRSQSRPWSGTSVGLIIRLICSIDCKSGLRPPWQQKIFSSTMAATGRQLKQSVKVFHNLMLYLRLPGK